MKRQKSQIKKEKDYQKSLAMEAGMLDCTQEFKQVIQQKIHNQKVQHPYSFK